MHFSLLMRGQREANALLKRFERARSSSNSAIAELDLLSPGVQRAGHQDLIAEAGVEHASLNLISEIQCSNGSVSDES